jgi:L-lactate dehydrogenase (cytochrome)
VWGLALGGAPGVQHMIEILRTDMVRTMRLMGCRSVDELDDSWVRVPPARHDLSTRV